ncbi:hypothetical protein [Bernardetia sp.]|uniref:hypothetical protein n=1 Tax=Bernardetia sp. TaxID=1937974 RepID=UPI0025C5F37D|nr:hypothetical protein [Bernardetia sp.]
MKTYLKFNLLTAFVAVLFLSFNLSSCGSKKAKIPAEGEKLMASSWKYDVNANLAKGSENVEDASGIKSNIELKGDVGKIADFAAETLTFSRDKKNKSKFSYKRKVGEGLISSSVVGYWTMSDDGKTITMMEWDSKAGKEKAPVNYTIVEITDDKLVLMKEGEDTKKIYKKKA